MAMTPMVGASAAASAGRALRAVATWKACQWSARRTGRSLSAGRDGRCTHRRDNERRTCWSGDLRQDTRASWSPPRMSDKSPNERHRSSPPTVRRVCQGARASPHSADRPRPIVRVHLSVAT
jgi:hypothetical protein